jgi:hypothetical protein
MSSIAPEPPWKTVVCSRAAKVMLPTTFATGSTNSLLFPGRVTEIPPLNQAIFNDKEKTDEYEYEG